MMNALFILCFWFIFVFVASAISIGFLYLIEKKTGYKKGFIQFLKEF